MALELKKISVTGARGFIGQQFLQDLSSSWYAYVPFEWDLLDVASIQSFFQKNQIDQIVHLVGRFEGTFAELLDYNVKTTGNILEQGVPYWLKKIIFASSGAVYGEPLQEESLESDLCQPNSLYGLTKRMAEETIEYYSKYCWILGIILRFPNVYGPKNTKGVVYNLRRSIADRGEVSIYWDGKQTRNFLHVSDASRALVLALGHNKSGAFNISNPRKISINDLVAEYAKNYTFQVKHFPQNNNLRDLALNIGKAEKELGFSPQVTSLQLWL